MSKLRMEHAAVETTVVFMDKIIFITSLELLENSFSDKHFVHIQWALAQMTPVCLSLTIRQVTVHLDLTARILKQNDIELALIHFYTQQ